MAYINSAMRGKVEVYLDEFETQVSTEPVSYTHLDVYKRQSMQCPMM